MKSYLSIFLILFALLPQKLAAGAWPKDVGAFFLSVSSAHNLDDASHGPDLSLFGEYGLRQNLTLTGKLTYDFSGEVLSGYDLGARLHVSGSENPTQVAVGLSLAGSDGDFRIEPGVHIGRGFDTPFGAGWADVELSASISTEGFSTEYESYVVVGIKPHDRVMAMLGVDVSVTEVDTFVKAVPSVAWQLNNGKFVNIQYAQGIEGTDSREIGVGIWLEF